MNSDELSKSILERFGFNIEKLPEPNTRKEADFLGTFDDDNFLIEAKIKTDSAELIKEKEETLAKGEVHVAENSLGRDEAISTIIRSGAQQLRSSAEVHDYDFKVLFIFSVDINARTKFDKVLDTLYGRTQIMECEQQNGNLKPCYFFRHADLFRRKDEIDAAIVGYKNINGREQLSLCFNPYSDKYDAIKNSSLANKFGGLVVDPIKEESNNRAYIPDSNVARSKSNDNYLTPFYNPMLQHLKDKYGTSLLINIDFESPELTIRT